MRTHILQRSIFRRFDALRRWLSGEHCLLARFSIGTRLAAMMALAALVALALAASGIQGLAASKESLHTIYEDRMKPVRALSRISHLMLANRLQLQMALNETGRTGFQATGLIDQEVAVLVAENLAYNMETIDRLWADYEVGAKDPRERVLAQRFVTNRAQYVQEAIKPALKALRIRSHKDIQLPASKANTLYEHASPDIQALIDLQFHMANAAYQTGVQRYEQTRWLATSALLVSMALLGLMGVVLIRSIVRPLQRVTEVFNDITCGKLDTPIRVKGQDEISNVLRALQSMQVKLAANEQAIYKLAYYDPLTQLPNRRLLRERMQSALTASGQDERHRALLLLDLDNFKTINDTLGHEVGDLHLMDIAQRLRDAVRETDSIARLGGDEFVVIVDDLHKEEAHAVDQVASIVEHLLAILNQPSKLAGRVQHTSASIGICLFRRNNATIKDLLKRADTAMYQAKNSGRNGFCFFDPVMQAQLENRAALEATLHDAVAAGQLETYFQAQVNKAGQPLGAEVLLRWKHPQQGFVPPGLFIPIAEASDLILSIGEWVLRSACTQLKAWEGQALTHSLTLAVNVSARQFRHADFVTLVRSVLEQTGANPARLVLELTESLVLHDIDDTIEKMLALRRHGVRFSLDDFGTGYSSLSHLKRLPLYQLKIDGSFVRDIVTDPSDAAIVQTIIGMSRNLGLNVIAEGVETEAQQQALLHLECPIFQGYLFNRPMPLGQFEPWLGQQKPLAENPQAPEKTAPMSI